MAQDACIQPPSLKPLGVQSLGPSPVSPEPLSTSYTALDESTQQALRYFESRGVLRLSACSAEAWQAPVSLAEWLVLLYDAADDKPWLINDAAYYADVPPDHWAYAAVEALRLSQVVPSEWTTPQGALNIDSPRSRRDALVLLGRSLLFSGLVPGQAPSDEEWSESQHLLEEYQLPIEAFSLEEQRAMGHVLASGFGPILRPDKAAPIDLEAPLTRQQAIRWAYHRHIVTLQRQAVLADSDSRIPEGLPIALSPTAVIFWERLEVGGPVYFVLQHPLIIPASSTTPETILPTGSRVFARVVSLTTPNPDAAGADQPSLPAGPPAPTARLMLEQVVPPNGHKYTVNANLILIFPSAEPRWFLPAAHFETVSKRVERLTSPLP